MSVELIVDNRENQLITELEGTCAVKVETLDIGDIMFRDGDEVILIIERKTIADLKASICDGRAREQKARLLHSGVPTYRIMYLIEGDLDKPLSNKVNGMPVSTLLGSIINTQLRDGIKVYKTASIQESAVFLQKMLIKLEKDGDSFFKQEKKISASEYSATLKKKKKDNMTPEVWFINQLTLIPQVTEKVAEQITAKYPSVTSLVLEYQRTPEHIQSKLLSDLTYQLSTGKDRRIGDKISARICEFFSSV